VLLVGTNGSRFELDVVGYQFPAIEDDEWDSNWLNITTHVQSERGSWSSTDPSLLTADIERLADWLDGVADGRAQDAEIDFMEPNLSFELRRASGNDVTVRVWFELESRPPWAPADAAGARDLWLDLDVSREDLRQAARDLRDQLDKFPPRALVR
jgi:hypothetical protein